MRASAEGRHLVVLPAARYWGMPTPSIADGYGRVSILFNLNASTHQCVITHGIRDNLSESPDEIAEQVRLNWLAAFPPAGLDDDWTSGPYKVMVNRGGDLFLGEDPNVDPGTTAQGTVSIGTCAVMRKRTGIAGRAFRGRCWLPSGYIPEDAVLENGVIDATPLASLTTNWQDYIDFSLANGARMNILNSATGAERADVVSGDIDNRVHFLRKRGLS